MRDLKDLIFNRRNFPLLTLGLSLWALYVGIWIKFGFWKMVAFSVGVAVCQALYHLWLVKTGRWEKRVEAELCRIMAKS